MKSHRCHQLDHCICSPLADEPDERCPLHGEGSWPPRCVECGRMMPYPKSKRLAKGKTLMEVFDEEERR